jgi:DNA-binding winged helix-turn-helix (wHTH) protein/Tol biopolymer transport system component
MSADRADPPVSTSDYLFGPFRFERRLRRLYKDGESVVLTPKAAETLLALLQRAGRVVEKDELLRAVWGDVFVGEDTLAQNISTLRRLLGDDPNHPEFIATIPRRGYKFVALVRTVAEGDATGANAAAAAPTPASFSTLNPSPAPAAREGSSTLDRARAPGRRPMWIAAALGTAAVVAAMLAVPRLRVQDQPRTSIEFTIVEPDGGRFSTTGGMLTMSPDGESVAFILMSDDGSSSLWVRPIGSTVARQLPDTHDAVQPFWSPDSRSIAFFSQRRLKAVDVSSGAVRVIASLTSTRSLGGSWSRQGEILFNVPTEGLYRVSANGGSPEPLPPAVESGCDGCGTWPQFLPDGRHFLYTVSSSHVAPAGIYVGEIGKPGGRLLIDAMSSSAYVDPGFIAYARAGTLFVQRFDPSTLQISGTAIPVSDDVAYNAQTGRVLASFSHNGTFAFRKPFITELVWVDRAGRPLGVAGPAATYLGFSIAPDGERVAAARVDPRTRTADIWVLDRGREVRVSDDPSWERNPVWSDDGRHVMYSAEREGRWRIYRRDATAVGAEEVVLDAETPITPLQNLRSAQMIYSASGTQQPFDVWTLDGGTSTPLARVGGMYPADARLSPDAQWLAYGRPETSGGVWRQTLYVSAPPFSDVRRAIAEAASHPLWRADGRELFYLSRNFTIVSIPIDPERTPSDAGGTELFRADALAPTGVSGPVYDVTRDGQRFLLKREAGPSPIHVVVNWDARLPR